MGKGGAGAEDWKLFFTSFFFIDLTRIINLYKQGVTFEDLYHKEETKFIWNATFLVLSLHRKAHNDTHVIPLELLELLYGAHWATTHTVNTSVTQQHEHFMFDGQGKENQCRYKLCAVSSSLKSSTGK